MLQVMQAPSDTACQLTKALLGIPSVQEVHWTAELAGEHLWVHIASWSDDDYFPVVRARNQVDPDHTLKVHVYATGDKTADGTSAEAPPGARDLSRH